MIGDGTVALQRPRRGSRRGRPRRLLRRDRADRRRPAHGDRHGRHRRHRLRAHLVGVPAARRGERDDRLGAAPGDREAATRPRARTPSRSPSSTRSSSARAGSPLSASASPSSTRPPKTTQRAPASAQRRATAAGAFPSHVVSSTAPLAGDDEVVGRRVEADQVENGLGARDELGAERGERRAEPAGRARSREARRTGEPGIARETAPPAPRPAPASRPSAARRAAARRRASSSRRTARASAPGSSSSTSSSPAPASIVAVPPTVTTEAALARARGSRCRARGDDAAITSSREDRAGSPRPPRRRVPRPPASPTAQSAAARTRRPRPLARARAERIERPFSAVGDRHRVAAHACLPETPHQRLRGDRRGQNALEASRARERRGLTLGRLLRRLRTLRDVCVPPPRASRAAARTRAPRGRGRSARCRRRPTPRSPAARSPKANPVP